MTLSGARRTAALTDGSEALLAAGAVGALALKEASLAARRCTTSPGLEPRFVEAAELAAGRWALTSALEASAWPACACGAGVEAAASVEAVGGVKVAADSVARAAEARAVGAVDDARSLEGAIPGSLVWAATRCARLSVACFTARSMRPRTRGVTCICSLRADMSVGATYSSSAHASSESVPWVRSVTYEERMAAVITSAA